MAAAKRYLEEHGVAVEDIRIDEYTQKRFTFFADPDGLPLNGGWRRREILPEAALHHSDTVRTE